VKAAFTPQRWEAFSQDAAFFRMALGPLYPDFLADHGFNPTPVWAQIGAAFARLVGAAEQRAILLLSWLDFILLLLTLAAVHKAFGQETFLLAIIAFCVLFGTSYAWTGGAYLRYLWFFGVVVGFSFLKRRQYGLAGVFLALAVMVRVFPIVFAIPLGFKALHHVRRKRRLPKRYRRFLTAFTVTAVTLFLLTGLLPRGYTHWPEFLAHMSTYNRNIATNTLGFTQILLMPFQRGFEGGLTLAQFEALKETRQLLHLGQLLLVSLPVMVLMAIYSPRFSDTKAVLLGLPLLLVTLTVAAYDGVFLVLLYIFYGRSARHLLLLLGAEVVSYGLLLFIDEVGIIFTYRSMVLLMLYMALFWQPTDYRQIGLIIAHKLLV
jgi:hypothetical protein